MIESSAENRLPFNAELIRSKGVNLTQQLDILMPFAEALAERTGVILAQLGGIPIKATLASTKAEKLKSHVHAEPGFDIVSETATVSCWGKSDTQFDNLMCEVCLGGTGAANRTSDNERPATTIDKKIRMLVSEKIATAVAEALGEIGEHADLKKVPRARIAARKAESSLLCYSIRLLLNVFDDACEYELFLSFSDCMKLIGGETALSKSTATSANELMGHTAFSLEVFLKPAVVDVRQILNLVPGEVLKLNIGASAPVELHLNGQKLTQGLLSFSNTGGHIKLLGEASLTHASEPSRLPIPSGEMNGR